ncbi:MAG: glycosyl hydrolase-related protein, partial [Propionibacteriaceae bacterium]|nr:glycosyl hydrolase-related protein [Propionibacteriaceae bacterium]
DQPNEYDAWDLDEHYRGPARPLTGVDSATWDRGADGSVTVTVRRHFGRSRAEQRTTVRPKTAAVDFTTTVDWHEANRLLKARFAVDVLADQSSSEIQFGHVRRPTHANTTWDAVKFEICAHRWVHVGEAGFGVAVANDSTYGHDVHRLDGDGRPGTSIGLSLLRAPQFPDPATDQGRHSFSYRLVAGADVAAAVQAGYELNVPVRVVAGAGPVAPLVAVDGPGVLVESVKLADDRSGDVVVRLYESLGGRATARVTWSFAVARAVVADLLERELEPSSGTDAAELAFRPFQIITLRLTRA